MNLSTHPLRTRRPLARVALVPLILAAASAWAQAPAPGASRFALEGAVIDSRSGNSLGVVTEQGDLNALFRAQKAVTFGILRAAGISLDQLSPDLRARIERFQTTNLEAFRAFAQGLDLKDQGRFPEAREQFRRAAELDPGFALAAEQQQAMPDVTLGSGVQTRALLLAATTAAVERGKSAFVVDTARAVAALQAGQTVVRVPSAAEPVVEAAATDFTTNPPGSGNRFAANQVVGLAYTVTGSSGQPLSLINPNEWTAANVRFNGGVLDSVGAAASGFLAQRLQAASAATGSVVLGDNSTAYWGSWLSAPGASAAVTVSGQPQQAPGLGRVDWVLADAPRSMPTQGTVVFAPAGGGLQNVSGTIQADFVNRRVDLQNLGFQIGSLQFSNLTGNALYNQGGANIASGAFSGNYTGGSCTGCTGFLPTGSVFAGNFVGLGANGLVFSTFMLTGNAGTAAGVHLFTRP